MAADRRGRPLPARGEARAVRRRTAAAGWPTPSRSAAMTAAGPGPGSGGPGRATPGPATRSAARCAHGDAGRARCPTTCRCPRRGARRWPSGCSTPGRPFHAHEVLEASWKAAPPAERDLWQGLAQLAVGPDPRPARQRRAARRPCCAAARGGSRPATGTRRRTSDAAGTAIDADGIGRGAPRAGRTGSSADGAGRAGAGSAAGLRLGQARSGPQPVGQAHPGRGWLGQAHALGGDRLVAVLPAAHVAGRPRGAVSA